MKIFLTFLALFQILTLFGQNYPYDKPELLLGKTVKPITTSLKIHQEALYQNFYLNYNRDDIYFNEDSINKPFPKKYTNVENLYISNYDSLRGKEFKVLEVYKSKSDFYIIELENKELGKFFLQL